MKITPNIIGILFISILIDFLEFTIILPLLPKILTYYGSGTDISHDTLYVKTISFVQFIRDLTGAPNDAKWNSVLFGGIIGSLFSFLQFFSSTLCGAASDRYGRKPVLLLSMIGISLSYAIWCVSYNLTIFMLARVIGGLSKANVAIILAIVSDSTTENERNRAMAWIGAAFSLGFIFGPLLGAICSHLDITILRRLGLASFLYMIVFAGLEFTITFLVYNRFNWNSMQQGKMFFIMGLCMALVQGGYVRRIPHGKEITAATSIYDRDI
ncbi:unnamed protein product [Rotaria magnacalcarata]|uniref:Major facilitator superfamily (MFS) profile domain-containing protein n=1 Tax=Rotaria magnacalcarata TaxID=392030 RepID=A0A8S2LZJ6_9BILA|nr:unnamed protein product [Rotaria magnacalcarata]